MKKLLLWAAILTVVAIVAGPASAGGKNDSSIQLVRMTTTLAATEGPVFGEQVTFSVSTSRTNEPYVWLACSQGGRRVYSHTAGFFASYPYSAVFTLGPTTLWTGGDAECEAQLLDRSHGNRFPGQVLARLTFHVRGA